MEDPNRRVAVEYDMLVVMEGFVAISNQARSMMEDKISLDCLMVRRIVPDEEDNWNKLNASDVLMFKEIIYKCPFCP